MLYFRQSFYAIHPEGHGGSDYVEYIDKYGEEATHTLTRSHWYEDVYVDAPCEEIEYLSIVHLSGALSCSEETVVDTEDPEEPDEDVIITITNVDEAGCVYFTLSGEIENGINVRTSTSSGFSWTLVSGDSVSPRCGFPATVTTWYQLQSLDDLSIYSNVFIVEVEPEPVPLVPTEIILVNSPYYISYNEIPFFEGILFVKLFIWSGEFLEMPENPTYEFTVRDNHIEVGQYIKDFLNPQPNNTYFTSESPSGFGECCNVYFEYDVWQLVDGDYVEIGTIESTLKIATLGYGLYSQGANPKLSLIATDGLVTIDTTLITIDSTEYTIDNGGYRSLFLHDKLYHKPTERIFDGVLTETMSGTNDVVTRILTENYIPVCGGKYKGKHLMYLNKNGFLDTYSFPFADYRKLKIKNDSYRRLISNPHNYNTFQAAKVHLNKETKVELTMNTGILDIYNVGVIEEIVNSDRHWLIDYDNQAFIPLEIITTNFDEKTRENDRCNLQYTLVFEQGEYKNDMH